MMFLGADGIGLDSDTVLRAIPVIVAVAGAIYKFRDARPRRRATLKADLELLKTARDQTLALDCEKLQAHVQAELSDLYERTTKTEWGWVVFGSVFSLFFGVWTAYLVKDGFSWWALGTGFFAFVGLGIVMNGLEDSRGLETRTIATEGSQEASGS
jgi:uncharacterized membrane protein (DUF2068 family)